MDAISFLYHPTEGMTARLVQEMDWAQSQACSFVDQHYADVETDEISTSYGWFLTRRGLPPVHTGVQPRPWPLAFVLSAEYLGEMMGGVPPYLALLARGESCFGYARCNDLVAARSYLMQATRNRIVLHQNNHGGLLGMWCDNAQKELVLAHVVDLR